MRRRINNISQSSTDDDWHLEETSEDNDEATRRDSGVLVQVVEAILVACDGSPYRGLTIRRKTRG